MASTLALQIARSLDACVQAYLAGSRSAELEKLMDGSEPEDEVHEGYRAVILAKGDEDTLVSVVLLVSSADYSSPSSPMYFCSFSPSV